MTAVQRGTLKLMAEEFRNRGHFIEAKYGKGSSVELVNVIEAFNQCAEELETFLNETLETRPQEQAPAQDPLRPVSPAQTINPS